MNSAKYEKLLKTIKARTHSARVRAATAVNAELVTLYWQIGRELLARQSTSPEIYMGGRGKRALNAEAPKVEPARILAYGACRTIWQDLPMTQPHLEKPGAGLPFFEALMVRWYVVPFQSRKNDKSKNLRLFSMAGARILKEASSVPESQRDQKVLVPRMKGVEDSSRFWCVNEVLEHLMITGVGMREVIQSLAADKVTDYVVRIENFKPKDKYKGGDAKPDFKLFLDETVKQLEPLTIEDKGLTHLHPWLGQFNALQWSWLLAGHSGLHLAQLQAIKKGL